MAISISRIAGIAAIFSASMASVRAPQAQETGIVVYNARHREPDQDPEGRLARDTGIPVTLRKGSDTELGDQLVQESALPASLPQRRGRGAFASSAKISPAPRFGAPAAQNSAG